MTAGGPGKRSCATGLATRVAFVLCVLAGCGDDEGSQGGAGNGTPAPEAIDACALVTQADATALFGQPAVQDQEDALIVDAELLGECLWTWDTDTSNQLLQLQVWGSPEYHSVPTDSEPFGAGQDGYIRVSELLGIDVEWVQDGLTVVMSYSNVGPDVPTVASKVEAMKALALEVESRLDAN